MLSNRPSLRITRAMHPEGGRLWAVYDSEAYAASGGSSVGPFATDASVVFTAATEEECDRFLKGLQDAKRVGRAA